MTQSQDACLERHKALDASLATATVRLNDHAKRIDYLEIEGRELKTEMKNVCKSLDNLVSTIKWAIGIFITVAVCVTGILTK